MPEFDFNSLANNPLLQYGMGLLKASGPSTQPHSFGQDLASAFDYQQGAQLGQLKNELLKGQVGQLKAWQNMFGGSQQGPLAPQAEAQTNGLLSGNPQIAKIAPLLGMLGPEAGMKMLGDAMLTGKDKFLTAGGKIYDISSGTPVPTTKGGERELKTAELKELFDTQDSLTSGEGALAAMQKAQGMMELPEDQRPLTGFGAETRASMERVPILDLLNNASKEQAGATTEFKTLISEQALQSLKGIFGGMPTEGERKVLLEMQALPSYTPEEQKRILGNAVTAVQRRMSFNQQKADAIKSGDYSGLGVPSTSGILQGGGAQLPQIPGVPPGIMSGVANSPAGRGILSGQQGQGMQMPPRALGAQAGQSDVPQGVDPQLWQHMTPEERALWLQ
jgi:hypothetical protein